MPSNEVSAEFYEKTNQIMELAGLPSYEISNYLIALRAVRQAELGIAVPPSLGPFTFRLVFFNENL